MATRREKEKNKARRSNAQQWAKEQGQGESWLKLPDGIEQLKLKAGTKYELDFLSYKVGENNPRADEGMEHFERECDIHWIAAPGGNRPVACRMKCFGKKCAVCDWLSANGSTADPELVKRMRGKTTHLWLVNDQPGNVKKFDAKKSKVLITNHYNKGKGFGEQMADAIADMPEGCQPHYLTDGYTTTFIAKEDTFPGGKYTYVTRINFAKRDEDYPESLLDELPCLDSCIADPGYDEIAKILNPQDDDDAPRSRKGKPADDEDDDEPESEDASDLEEEDEDEPAPKKGKGNGKMPTAKEFGIKLNDVVTYKKMECDVIKISGDGTSLTLEDNDGEEYAGVGPEEVKKVKTKDDEDDDDDEPAPPKKGGKAKAAPVEDDDEDEDNEDEPAPKKGDKKAAKDDDDDEEEDSDLEEDEEDDDKPLGEDDSDLEDEDEDEPAPKKGGAKKPAARKR